MLAEITLASASLDYLKLKLCFVLPTYCVLYIHVLKYEIIDYRLNSDGSYEMFETTTASVLYWFVFDLNQQLLKQKSKYLTGVTC